MAADAKICVCGHEGSDHGEAAEVCDSECSLCDCRKFFSHKDALARRRQRASPAAFTPIAKRTLQIAQDYAALTPQRGYADMNAAIILAKALLRTCKQR